MFLGRGGGGKLDVFWGGGGASPHPPPPLDKTGVADTSRDRDKITHF